MANITVGSGQTLSNLATSDNITVTAGGSVDALTLLPGATLTIGNDGLATSTVIDGGTLLLQAGGTTNGTVVNAGSETDSGFYNSSGTIVNSGGTLIVAGDITNADVRPGSHVVVQYGRLAGTIESGATVNTIDYPGGVYYDVTVAPGASVDYGTVPYSPGLAVGMTADGVDYIPDAARAGQQITVAGTISAAQTLVASDDGIRNPVTNQDGTIVTQLNVIPKASTINNSLSGAQAVLGYAQYDAALAPTFSIAGGVISAPIGGSTAEVLLSMPNGAAHTLTAFTAGQSVIAAGGGNDTVTVGNGNDLIATGVGANTVNLVSGDNVVYSEGNDQLNVGMGADVATISGKTVIAGGDASLSVFLQPNAQLTLHTGKRSVDVQGGFGSGTFSGGTDGHNLLVAGTGTTTLYAGGDGDVLMASGGASTTMNGWGGNETFDAQYSQGVDTFDFNGANVTAFGGAGENFFYIGTGNNSITLGTGTAQISVTPGAGGNTYISGFQPNNQVLSLSARDTLFINAGIDPVAVLNAATTYAGSETLHLAGGTNITFLGVTGLTAASILEPIGSV